jgi:DNA polymerase sigma
VLFGSAGAHLAVEGSDIDVLVHDKGELFTTLYHKSFETIQKVKRFSNCQKIICTVPILKLRDKKTGLLADITFNRDDCFKGVITALAMQV